MSSIASIQNLIKKQNIKFVDLRFTDTLGKEQHVTIPTALFDEHFCENGKMIDGSSIKGWTEIHNSDLCLLPDLSAAHTDPFYLDATLNVRCDVVCPDSLIGYARDPRSVAKRAEAYLKSTQIADTVYFGPEPEFFVFDDVRYETTMRGSFYEIDSQEAHWNSGKILPEGNLAHRPPVKGGYFPVPPVDSSQNLRSAISLMLEHFNIEVEAHHHEVATGNQNEVATLFNTLQKKADEIQVLKYVIHNVAASFGKTATFMPKPLVGDNGSGMHCHQSLFKEGKNIFSGHGYAGLSNEALYYIGGIMKHAKALCAFTNPSTNSYKRLVPGFEAPVILAYSAKNRSAGIRIPHVHSTKARRIEVRFPDALANPYLAFSAMMMAGVDGIINKIHPGDPMDKDLYDLPPEEASHLDCVSDSLEGALKALKNDHQFLLEGDVFTPDLIESYIQLKQEEINRIKLTTHPLEFEMYYSG